MYESGRPIRRSAIRSRLAINRLAKSGALGRRGRFLNVVKLAPTRPYGGPRKRPIFAGRKMASNRPQRVQATGGQITSSVSTLSHRPSKQVIALKRIGAPNHFTTNTSDFHECAAGFQGQWGYKWLDNSSLVNLRGTIGAVGTGSYRFCVESFTVECLLTNTTNAPLELEIWDLVLKKDIQAVMTYTQPTLGSYTLLDTPDQYWKQGSLIDAGLAPATSPPNSTFLGSSPYDQQLFRDYFKQVKKTIVMLPQGACHRHLVTRKTNRVIDDAFLRQGAISGHKGLTTYTMFNVKGFPCGSAFADPPPGGVEVTTTAGQISVVNTYRYKYTWVMDVSNFNTNQDNLTSPPISALNMDILNIGSGQPDVYKQVFN